jgi:hypothetical protein
MLPGFVSGAAHWQTRAESSSRSVPNTLEPTVACCEQCENVCEIQGYDSANCRRCFRHCHWCFE